MSSLKIVADALRAEANRVLVEGPVGPAREILIRVAARLEAEDRRIEGLRFPNLAEEREPDEIHVVRAKGLEPSFTLGDPAEETLDRPGNWRDGTASDDARSADAGAYYWKRL